MSRGRGSSSSRMRAWLLCCILDYCIPDEGGEGVFSESDAVEGPKVSL
jgi:hypothetical protein